MVLFLILFLPVLSFLCYLRTKRRHILTLVSIGVFSLQKEIARLITLEQGKTLADAEGDVFRGLRKQGVPHGELQGHLGKEQRKMGGQDPLMRDCFFLYVDFVIPCFLIPVEISQQSMKLAYFILCFT